MFHVTAGDDVKASPGDELSPAPPALTLLSVIIPARNEETCIASTHNLEKRESTRRNHTTNAFKAYRRSVIDGCEPLISPHFNLAVERPLKAITRGYFWVGVPITWRNRRHGQSKLRMKEMGSRYLFICFYVLLEKWLSRGDYRKNVTFTV